MIYTWKSPLNKAFKRIYKWGFILTMWNVNINFVISLSYSIPGFILTMWNVNFLFTTLKLGSIPRFILTMWNVN